MYKDKNILRLLCRLEIPHFITIMISQYHNLMLLHTYCKWYISTAHSSIQDPQFHRVL